MTDSQKERALLACINTAITALVYFTEPSRNWPVPVLLVANALAWYDAGHPAPILPWSVIRSTVTRNYRRITGAHRPE